MTDRTYPITPGTVTLHFCRICVAKIIEDLKLSNRIILDTSKSLFLITRFSLSINCIHLNSHYANILLNVYGRYDFKQVRGGYADYTSDIGNSIEIKVHNISRKKFLSTEIVYNYS